MPLLIDCYNLLHATMPPSLAGLEEERLCELLAVSEWAGEGISVVCDGVVKPLGLTTSPVDEVELIYSGPNRSADDVIIQMIDADSAPKRLTVVSTDREIRAATRRRRARVIISAEFVSILGSLVGRLNRPSGEPEPVPEVLPEDQVDGWLEEFGVDGDDPLDDGKPPWWQP